MAYLCDRYMFAMPLRRAVWVVTQFVSGQDDVAVKVGFRLITLFFVSVLLLHSKFGRHFLFLRLNVFGQGVVNILFCVTKFIH